MKEALKRVLVSFIANVPVIRRIYMSLCHEMGSTARFNKEFIDKGQNPLVCYRLYDNDYMRQPAVRKHEGNVLPLSSSLIQQSGLVRVEDQVFDLSRPGLYRFYKLPVVSEQRIVGTYSFDELSCFIGHLWSYGFQESLDAAASPEQLQCHKKIIVAGCGDISRIAQSLLNEFSILSRMVAFQTLNPWGGEDDGHTLLEVYEEQYGWFCYDPSFGAIFTKKGDRLSALDLQQYHAEGLSYDVVLLPRSASHSSFRHSNYDYGFWVDEKYHSKPALEEWYRTIGHVSLFLHDGKFVFSSEGISRDDVTRLNGLGHLAKEKTYVVETFY